MIALEYTQTSGATSQTVFHEHTMGAHIHNMQYLGPDLLVENDLQYSGYQRLTPGILP